MSIQQALAIEIQRETENTIRILKALPNEQFSYKPHPKSMSMGELANHIVELHGWASMVFTVDEFDLHKDYTPSTLQTVDELVAALEKMTEKNLEVVHSLTEEEYTKLWKLTAGDHVLIEAPRAGGYRFIITNHLIHHRGQLTVYMRLLDIPLPGIYGPSADEK